MIGRKVPGGFTRLNPDTGRYEFIQRVPDHNVLLCAEGPGHNEAEQGIPLVGASGAEVDVLLRRAAGGIRREDLWFTNIVKWRTDEADSDPEQSDVERDKPELYAELQIVQPRLLVAVGAVSTKFWLGPDASLDKLHGIPHKAVDPVAASLGTTVLPVYHPAAAMRQPDRYAYPIWWDFQQLGALLRGDISSEPPRDQYPSPVYQYAEDLDFGALPTAEIVAIDTEGWEDDPWGLSFSFQPGTGYIIRKGSPAIARFNEWLHRVRPRICLHHDLHDRPILRLLGVDIAGFDIEETMIQAFLLNNIHSRGLKTLSYRLNGMKMGSYSALTHEAELQVVSNYLKKAWEARICSTCAGSGEGTSRRVVNASCPLCLGLGRVEGKRPNSTKWCSCSKVTDKCSGCVDGAQWPAPPQVIDPETGKLKRPWSISRRLKGMLKSLDQKDASSADLTDVTASQIEEDEEEAAAPVADEEDSGESPYRTTWRNILPELRAPVEAELGLMPRTTLNDVADPSKVIEYVGADPDGTLRNFYSLQAEIERQDLTRVYKVDKAILPILGRMHQNGVLIDRPYFEEFSRELGAELVVIADKLSELVGYRINPSSPDQVSELLYGKLGIKPPKRSKKTGKPVTDEKTLESLKIKYAFDERLGPIVDTVLNHREHAKMKSTYVDAALELAGGDDRIRCEFLYTNIPTGRLAARRLNMMALPVRSDLGKRVARGFIPRKGCKLVSVDLDQVEMRIGAHLSQDPVLMALFIEGRTCKVRLIEGSCRCHDPHWSTAAKMNGIPIEEVSKAQRYPAKVVNFGVFYGMTETRLMNELALQGIKISRSEATAFLSAWFAAYPRVRPFLQACYAQARTYGYVTTLLGRRRYLPGVHSSIDRIREEALRQAGNAPVQGSAADIFRIILAKLDNETLPEINKMGYCEPLLPVHDAVVFEVEEGIAPYAQSLIEWDMAHAVELSVPLGASGAIADNLGALK